MGYQYVEEGPTADLTIDSWGDTLEESISNVAIAVFNAITPIEGVKPREDWKIEVDGDDLEFLLFNFLDEILYIHEAELVVFSEFDIEVDPLEFVIRAVCYGEPFDLSRHTQGIAIKAVTFHQMKIEKKDDVWRIRVVLDT